VYNQEGNYGFLSV